MIIVLALIIANHRGRTMSVIRDVHRRHNWSRTRRQGKLQVGESCSTGFVAVEIRVADLPQHRLIGKTGMGRRFGTWAATGDLLLRLLCLFLTRTLQSSKSLHYPSERFLLICGKAEIARNR